MSHLRWIRREWRGLERWLPLLLLLTVVATVAANGDAIMSRYIFNALDGESLERGGLDAVRELLAWILPLLGGIALLTILSGFFPATRALINNRIEIRVRERYFAEVLRKDDRFFQKFRTGDLVTRLMEDVYEYPKIAWFCCSGLFRAVESTGKIALCFGLMAYVDWRLALYTTAPLPATLFVFYLVQLRLARAAKEQREAVSRTNDLLESCFGGVRILKAFGGVAAREQALDRELRERVDIEMRLVRLMQLVHTAYSSLNILGMIVAFLVGGLRVMDGTLGVGDIYMYLILLQMIGPPLLDLPNLFSTSRQAFTCIDRLEEVRTFRAEASDTEHPGRREVDGVREVGLDGVRLAFDGRAVLEDVSLAVRAGERAAIVGRVGSGKSTLLRILAGLVRPDGGRVVVNGLPLEEIDLASYRRAVGYVPQEAALFSESIEENVVFGRESTVGELAAALETACVREEVDAFPDGTATVLGQRGVKVSGGQKQRLAVARALHGHPPLLLLDDVTAALDAENEDRFWKELSRTSPGTACLVVTHRIATARKMDRIHVLEEGRIVDAGTHDELVERCALYREFQQRERLLEDVGIEEP